MLGKNISEMLNKQIAMEFGASNLYLQMSAYFDFLGYKGFASYFKKQSEDEREHGLCVYDYLVKNRADVDIGTIAAQEIFWSKPLACIDAYFATELSVTEAYTKMGVATTLANDLVTLSLVTDFLDLQKGEEKEAFDLLLKVKAVDENYAALMILDNDLNKEVISVEFE